MCFNPGPVLRLKSPPLGTAGMSSNNSAHVAHQATSCKFVGLVPRSAGLREGSSEHKQGWALMTLDTKYQGPL